MKRLIAGTIALSTVLGTTILANENVQPIPISMEVNTTNEVTSDVQVGRPLIAIQPVQIAETNNIVLSYIPKAVNDSMYVTELSAESNDFGTPTRVWGLTFVNSEETEAPIGVIEEYAKSTVDTSAINTDIYDVFEADSHVYIAKVDASRKLYFPENSVDATVLDQYKDNLINFLDPYKIDATLSVQGINSRFVFTMPEDVMINAYNTNTYDNGLLDEFTFYYNPMNRKDMSQKVMEIVSTTETLGDEYMLLEEGAYNIYAKVYPENDLSVEMDINNYNDIVAILSDEELMQNHTQVPQIEDNIIEATTNVLVIDGNYTGIHYKKVQDGRVVVPLRETFEYLGFEVVWNAETQSVDLMNGPVFTSVSIGEDSYYFGRKAPVSLGIAPMIIDEKTYVPVEFLSQVLPYETMKLSNGNVNINSGQ